MTKIKILYIVSTLRKSGPTNQLYNIINNIDFNKFTVVLLTLSKEFGNSLIDKFSNLDIALFCLDSSRFNVLKTILKLSKFIKIIKPNLIHTQGIRADLFMAILSYFNYKYSVSTIRNFASEDYIPTYGKILGKIFAKFHWCALKRCKIPVACSVSLSSRLDKIGLHTESIQNGVDDTFFKPNEYVYKKREYESPLFIVLGSLNSRKNNLFLVDYFNDYFNHNKGTLLFIGVGSEEERLKSLNKSVKIIFCGNKSNPLPYLQQGDIFLSSSKSEGFPNSVLEAMACGLVSVLSNIPSHIEFKDTNPDDVFIYKLNNKFDFGLALKSALNRITEVSKEKIASDFIKYHSAKINSAKYQSIYKKLVKDDGR